jgi:hypothetical protein
MEMPGSWTDFKPEFERIVKRLMALMAVRDGNVRPEEVRMLATFFERLTGSVLDADDLEVELAAARADDLTVPDYLASVAHLLTPDGKDLVLKAVFLISSSDGEFHPSETRFMLDIGRALAMPPQQMRKVLDELLAHRKES